MADLYEVLEKEVQVLRIGTQVQAPTTKYSKSVVCVKLGHA